MKLDVSTPASIALAAFAIDRIVSAILFVLLYAHILSDPGEKTGADQIATDRNYKLVYFSASLVLVLIVLLGFPDIRILEAMGSRGNARELDFMLTGIVLLGGAERLGAWMKTEGTESGAGSGEPPIQVKGTLTLEDKRS
jgi:hypothetical protein